MSLLENKIPPPLVMLSSITVMWLLPGSHKVLSITDPTLIIAVAMGVIGALIAFSGVREFKGASTTVNPLKPDNASSLVTSGVFRFTRNPMYLGMVLVLLGNAVYLENLWSAVAILAFILFIDRLQIVPEERAMQSLFGTSFSDYCRDVRRWI